MSASFDRTVIGGTGAGLNTATALVESKLTDIVSQATTTLNLATSLSVALQQLGFSSVPGRPSVAFNAQLDQWGGADRPEIEWDRFAFQMPDDSGLNANIGGEVADVTADRPPVNYAVLDALWPALIDMLDGDALPEEWLRRSRERLIDGLTQARHVQEGEATTAFARRGWSEPTGAEQDRVEVLRVEYSRRISGGLRDLEIRFLELQVEVRIKAAELAIAYFRALVELYDTDADIDIKIGDQTLRVSGIRLQELQAKLEVFRTRVAAEQARIGAVAQESTNRTQQYSAEIGEADAIGRRDQAAAQIEIQRSSLESAHDLRGHEQEINERRRDIDEALNNSRISVDALTRVTQALWQAVNVSTAISSSSSNSFGQSLGASWSYSESKEIE